MENVIRAQWPVAHTTVHSIQVLHNSLYNLLYALPDKFHFKTISMYKISMGKMVYTWRRRRCLDGVRYHITPYHSVIFLFVFVCSLRPVPEIFASMLL